MIHRRSRSGYWGVNCNHDYSGIIILAGSDYFQDQARTVLSVKQAEEMIKEIQRQIEVVKSKADETLKLEGDES